jgi:hypothetical protein
VGPVAACAFTPDGAFLLSAGGADKSLRLWDAHGGRRERAVLFLPGGLLCAAVHPTLTQCVCGGAGPDLYFVDLVGVEYGPIIVTAASGQGLAVRCPACWQEHLIAESQLGTVVDCPTPGCGLQLRVNPFVIGRKR